MRLLDTTTLQLQHFIDGNVPPYAILSHTWGKDEVELGHLAHPGVEHRSGYAKILNACQIACDDGYAFIWIDTCCIDKRSSSELSEAINSMFIWYRDAAICYAYLADVDESPDVTIVARLLAEDKRFRDYAGNPLLDAHSRDELWGDRKLTDQFSASRWFTRGWTLQELLAPQEVIFYSSSWSRLTTRSDARDLISLITGIDARYLGRHTPIGTASIAKRMYWASRRCTRRVEDRAYCLLGICDVNMPLLYGEGEKAFLRLQEEILKQHDDQTLFAWTDTSLPEDGIHGLLASDPRCFQNSRDFVPRQHVLRVVPYAMTNKGLRIKMIMDYADEWKGYIQAGFMCMGGPSYSGFTTVYLTRLHGTLPQYSRVKCAELGHFTEPAGALNVYRHHWEEIFVNRGELSVTSRKIWPQSFFALRGGPGEALGSYVLKGVVSLHGGEICDGTWVPYYLRVPEVMNGHLGFMRWVDDSTKRQARWWCPEKYPLVYKVPTTATDLVAVALEFCDRRGRRVIVMIGTNSARTCGSDSGTGFDAYVPEPDEDIKLEHMGRFYRPNQLGSHVRRGQYAVRIADRTVKYQDVARILELDISIERDSD